jgi:actin-related protein 2
MSLYAEGMITGMLLDAGDGVTHCIPVVHGCMITAQCERMDIAGRHVTTHLLKLLQMRGYALNSTSDFETVREIKEKLCFVSGDIKVDTKLSL